MLANFDSLFDLMEAFPDEQAYVDHLRSIRWRDGEFCPHCGSNQIYHFSDRNTFKCGACLERSSIKVGTLRKWFMAIWLITNHPEGIASVTLAKDLKITQKSAWLMLHRLRHAARTNSFNAPLAGDIDADTTFVGGKEKNKRAKDRKGWTQGGAGKSVVLGMVEREGELRAVPVPDTTAKARQGKLRESVASGSAVLTDEDSAYIGLGKDFTHLAVNHSAGEYVRLGAYVHTNIAESVWALLKRQIVGIHHWVSPKHLQLYVDEMSWRLNRRDMVTADRMNNLFACVEGRLTHKMLVG